MNKLIKTILGVILCTLIGITIWILILWINNSILLSELKFYLLWGTAIIAGIISFIISKKYSLPKVISNSFIVVTIFSITLLLITGIIHSIVSSMP